MREFNSDAREPSATEIGISYNNESSTLTVSGEESVEWFTLDKNVTVENGAVTGNGEITVFAAKTDGSGVCAKITITLASDKPDNTVKVVCIVLSVIFVVVAVAAATVIVLIKRRRKH